MPHYPFAHCVYVLKTIYTNKHTTQIAFELRQDLILIAQVMGKLGMAAFSHESAIFKLKFK